jgi:hypothetical protein
MRLCTKEDFTSRGYNITEEFESKLNYRVCPDIAKDDPHYMVQNLYANKDERKSFSIQVFKCTQGPDICKSDEDIEAFLSKTQFNQ